MCLGDIMAKKTNRRKKSGIDSSSKQKNAKKNVNKNLSFEKEKKDEKKEIKTKVENKSSTKKVEKISTSEKEKTIQRAKRELVYSKNDSSDEITKLMKIILIVTSIMILFYGITVFVTRKVNAVKTAKLGKSDEASEIQYDSIIIGTMFNIEGRHFVLIYSEDDENFDEYNNLLKTVEANDEAPKVYKANLNASFNKMYLASESNYDSDLSKFKVKGTTLVEIDGDIKSTYDSYDAIKDKLNELK